MSTNTSISWTDATWNPVRGCSRVSEGCRNCYAERQAARNLPSSRSPTTGEAFAILNGSGPHWTGKVELIGSKLTEPLHWRNPRRVFVNSMSDLFHEKLPYPDILHVFQVMAKAPRHTFQILTKRPEKMRELLSLCWWRNLGYSPAMGGDHWVKVIAGEQRATDQNFLPNVWLGVSVEDQATADARIPELLRTPAAVRFVSYEPALAGVNFKPWLYRSVGTYMPDGSIGTRPKLNWIIVGGESGPCARPFDIEWARETIRQCKAAGVPVFVKQLGSKPVHNAPGCLPTRPVGIWDSKGGNWDEWNVDLRIREFPADERTTLSNLADNLHSTPKKASR